MKPAKRIVKARKSPVSPPRTEGLTLLDQDRASSVADEGGTSAAVVEEQTTATPTSVPAPDEQAKRRPQ